MYTQSKTTRSRTYLATINNPADKNITHETIIKNLSKYATEYIAMCDETGSQGTYHTHVFVRFKNAINFTTLKKILPTAHIDIAKGTSQQNKQYILKSAPNHNKQDNGSYEYKDHNGKLHCGINHTDTFHEVGTCPQESPGRRTDLEQMYQLVKDGYSDAEILEQIPDVAIKYIDKIGRLRLAYLTDKYRQTRRLELKVIYVCGKTGAGKTRDILDEYGDDQVYRVIDYKHPFDSYQCEPVICFDEFRSSLKLQDMLNYLDVYPLTLPARYSNKVACYLTVFVVSNWAFEHQYSELQQDASQKTSYEAWKRRFNDIVKVYTSDGVTTYKSLSEYLERSTGFIPVSNSDSLPFN